MVFFKMEIRKFDDSNIELLDDLATEARSEGYNFVQRTIEEWKSGVNRFSKNGEFLFGIFISDLCVGVGGLNVDPYIDDPNIGRIRHVYISQKYRQKGLVTLLLRKIILIAAKHFNLLRLYTQNPVASSFYESLGFFRLKAEKVSHILDELDRETTLSRRK